MTVPINSTLRVWSLLLLAVVVLLDLMALPGEALAANRVPTGPGARRAGSKRLARSRPHKAVKAPEAPGAGRAVKTAKHRRFARRVFDGRLAAALATRPEPETPGIAPAPSAPQALGAEESLEGVEELIEGSDARSAAPAISHDSAAPPLIWPIHGHVNSPFGRRHRRLHAGIDIGAPMGQPIVAAADGFVLYARASRGPMGNAIVLRHANGLLTVYAHLARVQATEGATVEQGEPIGAVGRTGHATGPHLHFAIREAGRPVNPQDFLPSNDDAVEHLELP